MMRKRLFAAAVAALSLGAIAIPSAANAHYCPREFEACVKDRCDKYKGPDKKVEYRACTLACFEKFQLCNSVPWENESSQQLNPGSRPRPKNPPGYGLLEPTPGGSLQSPSGRGTPKPAAPTPVLR
jgi:hypothetical protein